MTPLRTRIAPTPSGFLHLGNAFSFILTWLIARSHGGTILLRIDDLDSARIRPEYVEDIFQSLDWLGIDYDEGPAGPDDLEASFSQRNRLDLYRQQLSRLVADDYLFGCECTRTSIQRDSIDGRHPQECRQRKTSLATANAAWRIATPDLSLKWTDRDGRDQSVNLDTAMRDFVVRRKDGLPAYQLTSLVDDVHFGINTIVRGADLLDSTAAQRYLANILGMGGFCSASFRHHAIIRDENDGKLSKSANATSLIDMRKANARPDELFTKLSPLLGLLPIVASAAEALAAWREE